MKKLLAVLLTVIMVIFSFAACGTTPVKVDDKDTSTPSQTQGEISDTKSDVDESTPADTNKEEVKDESPESTPENNKNENQGNADQGNTNNPPSNTRPEETYVPGNNFFLNENNNFYDQNAISVRPKYVYWYDGKLVAKCFVVNGFNHPVYNINVKNLTFKNKDGLIAEGSFGTLNGVTLQPYTHVEWTFTFSSDCVAKYAADLTELIYESNVSNNF